MVRAKKNMSPETQSVLSVKDKNATPKKDIQKVVGTFSTVSSQTPLTSSGGGKKHITLFKKPKISQGKIVQKKHKIKSNVLKEIHCFQTHIGFLIPKAQMIRLIRGIVQEKTNLPLKFTRSSLNVLQEAFEAQIVQVLEYANLVARHAKRVTLFPSDINLVVKIRDKL